MLRDMLQCLILFPSITSSTRQNIYTHKSQSLRYQPGGTQMQDDLWMIDIKALLPK